jgi:polynucleotide 5'-kinase involved in rRNA processing
MDAGLDIPAAWHRLADELCRREEPAAILLLGESDSGKSSCAEYLARRLADAERAVEYIDLDPGQSRLGPPTSLSAAVWPPQGPQGPQEVPAEDGTPAPEVLRFIGSTSPPGSFLQYASAAAALRPPPCGAATPAAASP